MKKLFFLFAIIAIGIIPVNALVLTNGPDANITAPTNKNVGWQYCTGGATAIGPRLFCQVKHIPVTGFTLNGIDYSVMKVIEPPDFDIRFIVVDKIMTNYAKLYMGYTNTDTLNLAYMVGNGVTGERINNTTWKWSTESTRKKRWGYTGKLMMIYRSPDLNYFLWRTDQAASSSGDSGGGVFTENGEFIGPIKFGDNPVILGDFQSGGVIAGPFYDLIKEYVPYLNPTNSIPSNNQPNNQSTNISPLRWRESVVKIQSTTTPVATPPPIRTAVPYTNPAVISTNKPK